MWHTYKYQVEVNVEFNRPPTSEEIALFDARIEERLVQASLGTEDDWTPIEGGNMVKIKGCRVDEG